MTKTITSPRHLIPLNIPNKIKRSPEREKNTLPLTLHSTLRLKQSTLKKRTAGRSTETRTEITIRRETAEFERARTESGAESNKEKMLSLLLKMDVAETA